MYLFGGSSGEKENRDLYTLDLQRLTWSIMHVKYSSSEEDLPITRDEHSCVVLHDSMIIFGGFAFGRRTNDIFRFNFKNFQCTKILPKNDSLPCPRAGHSASIRIDERKGDCMYIFGGKDDENNKLDDLWKFNFQTKEWTEIRAPPN